MEEFDKWNMKQPEELPSLKERGHSSLLDAVRKQGWKAALIEVDKAFVSIIRLCDNASFTKQDIRQVANDACSFIYLEQKETDGQ